MSYNDEAQPGGLVSIWHFIIPIALVIIAVVVCSFWQPTVNGTKRWETYTGVLLSFDIDCEQCCHASSGFSINTSTGVQRERILDCDEDLEHIVHVGNVYTIRLEPYAEPYASTTGSYWAVTIDWIKDVNGNVIYGNEWI
jgi:hypothetical protein